MGRKIPGRKHHGIRDPEKQRAERINKIKDKINAPPSNPDDQQVPRSLQRLVELKEKAKSGAFGRKKEKRPRPPETFQQRPNETNRAFLQRVSRRCAVAKHEAAFEQKFGVAVERDADGEVIGVSKRLIDPMRTMIKDAKRNHKKPAEAKVTKSQKRRLKLAEKKRQKRDGAFDDFSQLQDEVGFGEQVHAPPTLTTPKIARKIEAGDDTPRPGRKDLLLKQMLNKTSDKVIDKKGKRKDLPHALRRQLDQQQKEVINAYKLLKTKIRNQ